MAKKKFGFEEPFEETQAMYNQAILDAGLNGLVNISILSDNKAKEIFKLNKPSKLHQYRTDEDVIIVLNEKIFDQLEESQRRIVVEESLSGISYDTENDKLEIKQPDVKTFKGVLRKHTYKVWEVVQESITTLYQVEKDEEQARKDAAEAAKPKKKF